MVVTFTKIHGEKELDMETKTPKADPQKMPEWVSAVETLCFVAVAASGYFFLTRPTRVPAAILFRIALTVLGTAGYIAIQLWTKKRNKNS